MEQKAVLLLETDFFARSGLCRYLVQQGFTVVEAAHANDALERAQRETFAAAIVNGVISVDGRQTYARGQERAGLDLVRNLKDLNPDMGIVLLCARRHRGEELLAILRMMRGVVYRIKDGIEPDDLMDALEMAIAGEVWIDPRVDLTGVENPGNHILELCRPDERRLIQRALNRVQQLTPAELVILSQIGHAGTTKRIARELGVTPGTVESHTNHIYTKLFGADADGSLRRMVLLTKVALIRELVGADAQSA
ncbi:MAG: LuxR C-terminal-related transcriptional regulator [Anaerolineae bacterium]|nr:LuxR C-terminal-related transcriptional regulator [Anaerolineae bacterium]